MTHRLQPARRGTAILLATAGLLLTACGSLAPSDSAYRISHDIYDIKTSLNTYLEEQESTNRQMQYALNAIDENLQGRNEVVQNTINDMEIRMREQLEEIQRLRSELEALSFSVDRLSKQLDLNANFSDEGELASPTEPATDNTVAIEQLLESGAREYNLGNYRKAREAYMQAREMEPSPEQQIEVMFRLGEIELAQQNYDEAMNYFSRLIETNNRHIKAWVSLERIATISEARGDLNHALMTLQYIDNVNPDYPEIERVRETIERLRGQLRSGSASDAPMVQPMPSAGSPPATTTDSQPTTF